MKFLTAKFKICVFLLAITFGLSAQGNAEYNLATKKQEHLLFGTAREVQLGRSTAQRVEKEFAISNDAQLQARVEQIGQKLAAVCDRKDIIYCFRVLETEEVNAFSLPGGYVYVNKGLIEKTASDDELAGVLAHKIGHIVARHSIKRLQASLGYNLLSILAVVATKDPRFKKGTDLAFSQLMLGYAREDELLADQLAIKYLRKAGYNPEAVVTFLKKLQQIEKERPLRPLISSFARTHPYISQRIGATKQEIYGQMDFSDYINIEN